MKKVSILWMSALLLMLAGCSGDELIVAGDSGDELMVAGNSGDETGDASDLVGYWKVIDQEKSEGKDPNTMGGLCFKENGEIIAWGKGSENWYERYTGKWWVSDEGELLVDVYEGTMCHVYTGIERLSKTRLVIRNWGGFVGTSREEGYDVEYMKLDHAPNYDHLSKYEW